MATVREKFAAYLVRSKTGCLLFTGYLDKYGYGVFTVGGKQSRAHRTAYKLAHGKIPASMDVHHKCFVRNCCAEEHLAALPWRINRAFQRSSFKPACKHGHKFSEANTYRRPNGGRDCRCCIRARVRKYKKQTRKSA